MYYSIERKLVKIEPGGDIPKPFVAVLTPDEFGKNPLPPEFDRFSMPLYPKPRFCKAEVHECMLSGTLSIPDKKSFGKHSAFSYYINKSGIIFVDSSGLTGLLLENIEKSALWREPSAGHFFYTFMETLVENDLRYLEGIEDSLAKLEISVLSDKIEGFMYNIIEIRKKILAHSHYYSQLSDVGLELLENKNEIFEESSLRVLKHFSDRAHRLRQETQMLREYSLQISEAYQAQIDIRQNIVMKVLTVVTAIFLPLSLIAGWYGMNFENMPELHWYYGYIYVIFLSIIVVIVCLGIFRRKKYLK
ncbi:MAG: CorA family divalent cation transporter [Synergistaceae bacterium]|nr:CorA family divalent cation transporter [Synergistaceae bacterium]